MVESRLYKVWMGGVVIATALLLAAIQIVDQPTIQMGMILGAVLLGTGPLLYEPRLQAIGWRLGLEGPADERHEMIIFRTGWYAYHLLGAVVLVYILVNGATEFTIPEWGLGFGFVVIFTGYWGIAWWQSKVS